MSIVLLLVAIVPLVGIGMVSISSVRAAQRTSSAATTAESSARKALAMSRIEGSVVNEMFHAIDDAISPRPDASTTTAEARVDQLLDPLELGALSDALSAARGAPRDLLVRLQAYEAARSVAVAETDQALEELLWSITAANHDGRLLETALGLVYLIDTDRAIAEQFLASVALAIDVREPPRIELARLIEQRGRLNTNLATLLPLTDVTSTFGSESALRPNQVFEQLLAAIDRRIETALDSPLPGRAPSPRSERAADLAADMRELRSITANAGTATAGMLEALTVMATAETTAVSDQADRRAVLAYTVAAGLIVATIAVALVASRFIVRPIRTLERAANDLRDGISLGIRAQAGPAEIRAAASAIGEAAVHLELVTDQALALASGDLDAAVLQQHDPTGLGAALQSAVATLRNALIEQDELRRQLAHEATHDGLTGLPNRRASLARLSDALARWRRTGGEVVVMFLDLDHFKEVNDAHGHRVGDLVLAAVGQRLLDVVREGDHVGRLGGDEFVVIAEPLAGPVDATALAGRILAACTEPLVIDDHEVRVGVSIGVARGAHADGDADEVLHHADLSLYRAKSAGRGIVFV